MLKTAKGNKTIFRIIANTLVYKMHATTKKFLSSTHFDSVGDVVQTFLIKVWQSASCCLNKRSVEEHIYKIVFQLVLIFLIGYLL